MTCFLFGHAPSRNDAVLEEAILDHKFKCRRCDEWVSWTSMPKAVRQRVELTRSALLAARKATTASAVGMSEANAPTIPPANGEG